MAKKKQTLTSRLSKEYGEESIINTSKRTQVITTGAVSLDVSVGIGGLPMGRYTEIYGPESGGKTTLCLTIAKYALLEGLRVMYIDVENSLDIETLEMMLGDKVEEYINEGQLIVFHPKSAEDAFKVAEEAIEEKIPLIFFDSVAAIAPLKEMDADFSDSQVALSPRLVAKFLRRTVFKIREADIAFVFTNQVRDTIGSIFGGYSTPAGHALKHFISLKIYVSRGKMFPKDDPVGQYVNFIIKKNKVGTPQRQATTNILFGKGIEFERDVVSFAKMLGVLISRGPFMALAGEDSVLCNNPGMENMLDFLRENPNTLDKIIKMCYDVSKVSYPDHGYVPVIGERNENETNKETEENV